MMSSMFMQLQVMIGHVKWTCYITYWSYTKVNSLETNVYEI